LRATPYRLSATAAIHVLIIRSVTRKWAEKVFWRRRHRLMFTGLKGILLGELRDRCEGNIKIDPKISALAWTEFVWLKAGPTCGLFWTRQ